MFRVKGYGQTLVSDEYPVFSLSTDSWDDFGTKCTFNLRYHQSKKEVTHIGELKILQLNESTTKLKEEFEYLGKEYISLGQDIDFYENLLKCVEKKKAELVLESLNDISWQANKAEEFESKPAYRNALFRENSAHNAFRFGRSVILGEQYDDSVSFEYKVDIESSGCSYDISIDFNDDDILPSRIVGIIGRNAVGKTHLMGSLAKDLVQVGRVSQKTIDDKNKRFKGNRPIFNRVITISYSAFDKFIRPKNPQASYVYCGIRDEKGGLSKSSLIRNYKCNLQKIREQDRASVWADYMAEILDELGDDFKDSLSNEIDNIEDADSESLSLLSSGQSILAHFVTALVARIQENTLVLFDEPETHLHPNAVANLFNVMNKMLRSYKSYAIIATHSPIVIQEIPSKRVILLTREGDSTIAKNMQLETFGESISELTRHVFDTASISNYYKLVLKQLSRRMPIEEVNALFNNNLSFNAKAYLIAQYGGEK
ncbi:TPA: AAA family ATPase [Vibrio cholerae]|uniref:AAA family ATPase n=2 Tax=Vibrio TaxID=662 RepID=UPI001A357240|nr:AAA family ATPase [Vibrio cholerae]EHR6399721.1 AAA family ATPase [Vibrio parahaemolyticus]HDY8229643.1 AAA family ATPase [Vibrio vulnificus]EKD4045831.1 AAA family ATPase [Vibrio parahaemolyticus]MCD9210264.1 AAA family ATPase [Vibrio cholerae]MDV2394937.1 AAA family ATPase [Vibrio cholerae]